MLYGMYVSAAGALGNSYRQDVIANNLANAETVGFKRDLALFTARPTEAETTGQRRNTTALLEGLGGGTFALPTHTDFSSGGLEITNRDYDLALEGRGFFSVLKDGETLYTRDGRFGRNEAQQLVTLGSQLPVLDAKGKVITLDPDKSHFQVSPAGVVSQDGEAVAQLGVVDFEDLQRLQKRGDSLFDAQGMAATESLSPVKQGQIEKSSVQVTEQMIAMIKTQRMFESNLSMLRMQDETLGRMIERFGR